jgi:hypothetical protein
MSHLTFAYADSANDQRYIHNVHTSRRSSLDPGGHLACLDVAGLLPLHFPWVTRYSSS